MIFNFASDRLQHLAVLCACSAAIGLAFQHFLQVRCAADVPQKSLRSSTPAPAQMPGLAWSGARPLLFRPQPSFPDATAAALAAVLRRGFTRLPAYSLGVTVTLQVNAALKKQWEVSARLSVLFAGTLPAVQRFGSSTHAQFSNQQNTTRAYQVQDEAGVKAEKAKDKAEDRANNVNRKKKGRK